MSSVKVAVEQRDGLTPSSPEPVGIKREGTVTEFEFSITNVPHDEG